MNRRVGNDEDRSLLVERLVAGSSRSKTGMRWETTQTAMHTDNSICPCQLPPLIRPRTCNRQTARLATRESQAWLLAQWAVNRVRQRDLEHARAFAWIIHMHCLAVGFCYLSPVVSLAKPSLAGCSEIIASSLSKNTMDNLQTKH